MGASNGTCDLTDPMAAMYPAFETNMTYTGGERVSYQGLVYQAKWWTRGNSPDSTDAFELISDVTLEYSDNTVYEGVIKRDIKASSTKPNGGPAVRAERE